MDRQDISAALGDLGYNRSGRLHGCYKLSFRALSFILFFFSPFPFITLLLVSLTSFLFVSLIFCLSLPLFLSFSLPLSLFSFFLARSKAGSPDVWMRQSSLSAELEAITHEYDYGIVPGSATVFVQDEENNLGRLEMTLLESVLIIVDVTDQGFAVMSCAPLTSSSLAIATAQNVQAHVTKNFESMESLLITLSPLFCQRFQDTLFSKLQGVQNEQQQQEQQQQQQQQAQEPSSYLSTANTVTPEQTLSSVGPATDNPHNPQHIFPPASISSQTTSNIPSHDPTDQLLNPSTTTTHTDHQLIPEEELLKQWLQ